MKLAEQGSGSSSQARQATGGKTAFLVVQGAPESRVTSLVGESPRATHIHCERSDRICLDPQSQSQMAQKTQLRASRHFASRSQTAPSLRRLIGRNLHG
jgi:hypothetical protein